MLLRMSTAVGGTLMLAVHCSAIAEEVTIGAAKDNTIWEVSSALSNGAGSRCFAGNNDGGWAKRALIQFDVAAAVPDGATIDGVILTLFMSKTSSGGKEVSLHRLLADWGEGTSNAPGQEGGGTPATPGDATWKHTFYSTDFWGSQGGDFVPTPSASISVGGIGFYEWNATPEMIADVQAWHLNPDSNFGWLILGDESTSKTTKRFDTRENTVDTHRPALLIQYSVACDADVTDDGVVDVLDLLAVLSAWGQTGDLPEDITGDGVVDVLDLLEVLSAWGPC